MKNTSLLWNLARVVLILFCGFQLVQASMSALKAARMLSTMQLPRDHHESTSVSAQNLQAVEQVLHRIYPSSLYYAGLLVILALSPYATNRKGEGTDKEVGAD